MGVLLSGSASCCRMHTALELTPQLVVAAEVSSASGAAFAIWRPPCMLGAAAIAQALRTKLSVPYCRCMRYARLAAGLASQQLSRLQAVFSLSAAAGRLLPSCTSELTSILAPPLALDSLAPCPYHMLVSPSAPSQGDYHRYLAEFKTGAERKEAAEHTLLAYKAAQVRGSGTEGLVWEDGVLIVWPGGCSLWHQEVELGSWVYCRQQGHFCSISQKGQRQHRLHSGQQLSSKSSRTAASGTLLHSQSALRAWQRGSLATIGPPRRLPSGAAWRLPSQLAPLF